ncbi:hypothetical protein C7441_11469 [Pseudaminobacter salicylatoxidans]|uniref:Uncharacterized protein n=1 Tax=Pseudaminobacter salicylatoxidans TaxID=93369 RepID=A0A316CKM7_PSESE|nr:hypothetical protein C7441_11469 [Pseudaminobacter salicylatoxidans]
MNVDPLSPGQADLAETPRAQHARAIVPDLANRFHLTAKEACEVAREYGLRLARAG